MSLSKEQTTHNFEWLKPVSKWQALLLSFPIHVKRTESSCKSQSKKGNLHARKRKNNHALHYERGLYQEIKQNGWVRNAKQNKQIVWVTCSSKCSNKTVNQGFTLFECFSSFHIKFHTFGWRQEWWDARKEWLSDLWHTDKFSFQIVLYSFEKVKEKSLFVLYSNCLSTCQKAQKTKTKQVVTQ